MLVNGSYNNNVDYAWALERGRGLGPLDLKFVIFLLKF